MLVNHDSLYLQTTASRVCLLLPPPPPLRRPPWTALNGTPSCSTSPNPPPTSPPRAPSRNWLVSPSLLNTPRSACSLPPSVPDPPYISFAHSRPGVSQCSENSPSSDQQDEAPQQSANAIVSVSTTFHPGANLLQITPDLILLSSDGVFFYVHTTQVLSMSNNHFNGLVSPTAVKTKTRDDLGPVLPLPEAATVLNIVLHVVYEISCAHYHPGIDTLISAVDAMPTYGLRPSAHIAPSTPLYSLILSQAPVQPINAYALAAAHDLYDLAVPISSHLLSFVLHTLTDEAATRIGPVYLKRLFFQYPGWGSGTEASDASD